MNYWIFIVTSHDTPDGYLSSNDIYSQRMRDRFWGLGEKTRYRETLNTGDQIIFYMGNPYKVFAGTAVLASDSYKLNVTQQNILDHDMSFYRTDYGVQLVEIEVWRKRIPIESVIRKLEFIRDPLHWGTYFQGGIRTISPKDYRLIISIKNENINK